jgi:hypothetical protein
VFVLIKSEFRKKVLLPITLLISSVALMSTSVSADYFSGGRTSGIFNVYFDPSVASANLQTEFNTGFGMWNDISTKVKLTRSFTLNTSTDRYYAGTSAVPNELGRITPYKASGSTFVPAQPSEVWSYSALSVYTNNMGLAGMSSAEKIANVAHEVGHTLSQAHPSTSQNSVMMQGVQSFGPLAYDKTSLKSKWGN